MQEEEEEAERKSRGVRGLIKENGDLWVEG